MRKLVSYGLTMTVAFWVVFTLGNCGGGDSALHCKSYCELMIECGKGGYTSSDLDSCTNSCIDIEERNAVSSWDKECKPAFNAWADCIVAIKDCCEGSCPDNTTCADVYNNYGDHCLARPGG